MAPVEYVGGWSLLAAIGTAFVVLTADTFAFHARARGEALVPGAVLFVFVAALGADRHRVGAHAGPRRRRVPRRRPAAHALRAAAADLARRGPPPAVDHPAGGRRRRHRGRPRRLGDRPAPAGRRRPSRLSTPTTTRGGVTEVLSPLVDIRSRLVNRSDTELFVVRATAPAYWRVSGLPEFDGSTWGLPDRSLEDVDGDLSVAAPGSTENRQEIVVSALRGKLVPGAAEPVAADGEGLRWNAETSTLVRVDRDLEAGRSVRDRVGDAELHRRRAAGRHLGGAAGPDLPRAARRLPVVGPRPPQRRSPRGAPTTYDAMLALQNWFRTEFQYSLDVPQGHSNSAIEAFLRQRVGYCEQFAGTFAAMARSLGVPARVAVGYTPGLAQADGTRSVLGKNAHAWPEVWFDGLGWVPFEPTPGRGAPGAEALHRRGGGPGRDRAAAGAGRRRGGHRRRRSTSRRSSRSNCHPSRSRGSSSTRSPPAPVATFTHARARRQVGRSSASCAADRRRSCCCPRSCAGGAGGTRAPTSPARSATCGGAPSAPSRRRGTASIRR